MKKYVSEEELTALKKNIEDNKTSLSEAINSFSKAQYYLSEVIEALENYYKTNGGKEKTEKIRNINFGNIDLSSIVSSINNINCNYHRETKKISTRKIKC